MPLHRQLVPVQDDGQLYFPLSKIFFLRKMIHNKCFYHLTIYLHLLWIINDQKQQLFICFRNFDSSLKHDLSKKFPNWVKAAKSSENLKRTFISHFINKSDFKALKWMRAFYFFRYDGETVEAARSVWNLRWNAAWKLQRLQLCWSLRALN